MVTSVEQIRAMAVKEVEISGFEPGEVITLQLKGISLTGLIQGGQIPNQLLGTAIEMFEGKKKDKAEAEDKKDSKKETEKLPETIQMMDIICRSAMVEPKYEDVKEYLTDTQKMEIFTFTQGGVNALNSFRAVKTMPQLDTHSIDIQQPTEPIT